MKLKLILTTLLIGVVSLVYTQNELEGYESKKVDLLKRTGSKFFIEGIEGKTIQTFKRENHFYTFYKIFGKKIDSYWIEKFDSEFNSLDNKKLNLTNISYFEGVYELENDFIFSCVERIKSTYKTVLYKFNFEKFEFDTKAFYEKEISRKDFYFKTPSYDVIFKANKLSFFF